MKSTIGAIFSPFLHFLMANLLRAIFASRGECHISFLAENEGVEPCLPITAWLPLHSSRKFGAFSKYVPAAHD